MEVATVRVLEDQNVSLQARIDALLQQLDDSEKARLSCGVNNNIVWSRLDDLEAAQNCADREIDDLRTVIDQVVCSLQPLLQSASEAAVRLREIDHTAKQRGAEYTRLSIAAADYECERAALLERLTVLEAVNAALSQQLAEAEMWMTSLQKNFDDVQASNDHLSRALAASDALLQDCLKRAAQAASGNAAFPAFHVPAWFSAEMTPVPDVSQSYRLSLIDHRHELFGEVHLTELAPLRQCLDEAAHSIFEKISALWPAAPSSSSSSSVPTQPPAVTSSHSAATTMQKPPTDRCKAPQMQRKESHGGATVPRAECSECGKPIGVTRSSCSRCNILLHVDCAVTTKGKFFCSSCCAVKSGGP